MSSLIYIATFAAGFLLGAGATLFYLRWKMMSQLGQMEEQMSSMMELSDEMSEIAPEEEKED